MPKRTPIRLDDLEAALDGSSSADLDNQAFIDRSTGKVHFRSLPGDADEDLPEDIEDGARYIAAPHRNELDLGRDLVFEFVAREAAHLSDPVHSAFRRKGAYAEFKSILDRAGLLDRWYRFEDSATKDALLRWAKENDFEVLSDAPAQKPLP